jgi:hypothetical protein
MQTFKLLAMIIIAAVAVAVLSACDEHDQDYNQRHNASPVSLADSSTNSARFTVVRVAVFRDKLAYEGKRGIYTITDTTTGKEMLGISGVGISDLGLHSSGKTSTTDER